MWSFLNLDVNVLGESGIAIETNSVNCLEE